MAVNFSSTSSGSLLHPGIPLDFYCYFIGPGSSILTAFFIANILLLLPLCILIIYLGLQQWRHHRSTSAAAATSHSESLTFSYHMVAMEMVTVLGCVLCCCGINRNVTVFIVGYCFWSFTWYGETFFHILTCVERYLAVAHPVTYLSLRGERGTRIRNISIGCVWLLSFGATCLTEDSLIFDIFLLFVSVIVISVLSISVLLILIRPGPGERGRQRESFDQSKRRAFSYIVAILGMLVLRFCGNLVWWILLTMTESIGCAMRVFTMWLNIPSSLMLPLLFLHRAGTCACCKTRIRLI